MRAQNEAGLPRRRDRARRAPSPTASRPARQARSTSTARSSARRTISREVVFFYNKELVAKAGVDPTTIKTWDDFLAAVKKIKEAGITPIIMGGGEKWPMHFYWSYLVMREGGAAGADQCAAPATTTASTTRPS